MSGRGLSAAGPGHRPQPTRRRPGRAAGRPPTIPEVGRLALAVVAEGTTQAPRCWSSGRSWGPSSPWWCSAGSSGGHAPGNAGSRRPRRRRATGTTIRTTTAAGTGTEGTPRRPDVAARAAAAADRRRTPGVHGSVLHVARASGGRGLP